MAIRVSAGSVVEAFAFKNTVETLLQLQARRALVQIETEVTVVDMTRDGDAVNSTPLAVSQILTFFGIAVAAAAVASLIVFVAYSQMMPSQEQPFVEFGKGDLRQAELRSMK